jgi:hypothetical protein
LRASWYIQGVNSPPSRKLWRYFRHAEEHLLHQVLRRARRRAEAPEEVEQPQVVALEEHAEPRNVAVADGAHELGIGLGGGWMHAVFASVY